jgi:hypothetical protein
VGVISGIAAAVVGSALAAAIPKLSTVNKWQRALEAAGVEFMDEGPEHGSGVRLQKGKPKGK